jgi:hypothetical protein
MIQFRRALRLGATHRLTMRALPDRGECNRPSEHGSLAFPLLLPCEATACHSASPSHSHRNS